MIDATEKTLQELPLEWIKEFEALQPRIAYRFTVWDDNFDDQHVKCINEPGKAYDDAFKEVCGRDALMVAFWCDGFRIVEKYSNGAFVESDIGGSITIYTEAS